MSVAKLSGGGTLDFVKSGDGNESLDMFLPQTIGKEPFITFSRTGDNPVQLIQLLHSLDQPDLPGWPLLTPLKVQMHKCEKCSREFCSLINYRRHIRVHRRSLNVDKESHKIRDVLAAFWDKLSLDDVKEVVSFNDVTLKDITGSSVIKALASSLRKPGVWTLPQFYVKAGSTLLDIIYAKPSGLPISSQELLSILDDASERTFLCAGMAESVQKYVFDGEAEKIAFELKNIIACVCFFFEQKLVKAWLAEKDVEALRCQKLLVEEEEDAQRRIAQLLEKKRQKKLRQKEQKAREHSIGQKNVLTISTDSLDGSLLVEESSLPPSSDSNSDAPEILGDISSSPEPFQFSKSEETDVTEGQYDLSSELLKSGIILDVEPAMVSVDGRWQVPKLQRRNGFQGNQNQVMEIEPVRMHVPANDLGSAFISGNMWTKKTVKNVEESLRPGLEEAANQAYETECELIIGSISVPVGNCISRKREVGFGEAEYSCSVETVKNKRINILGEASNFDILQCGVSQADTELQRPDSSHERKGSSPIQRVNLDFEEVVLEKLKEQTAPDGSVSDDGISQSRKCLSTLYDGAILPIGLQFSTVTAKTFLAERWKEAFSAEHVELKLPTEPEPPGRNQTQNDASELTTPVQYPLESSFDVASRKGQLEAGHFLSNGRKPEAKVRRNREHGVNINCVPRQKVVA